jgi:hypothetical protein
LNLNSNGVKKCQLPHGRDYSDSLPAYSIVTGDSGGVIEANVYDFVVDQVQGRRSNFGFIILPAPEESGRIAEIAVNDQARLSDARLIIAYRNSR